MKIFKDVFDLVGNTPLVRLPKSMQKGLYATVLLKLESKNPTGSAKDRIAKNMLLSAEREGKISAGATIIEPTSGNTGIGLAAMCAARGYHAIMVMPSTMSVERRKLISVFGAQIVLTDGKLGMNGAVQKAEELHQSIANSIVAGQFVNPANPEAHYLTTGPEIYQDTRHAVDILVATVGTGGTLSGTARYLKEQNPKVVAIAVEPAASPLLSTGVAGAHKIQGIGANFVPNTLDRSVIDEIVTVTDDDALQNMLRLAREAGLLVGISAGAALSCALQVASRAENRGKTLVAILTDTGERYLSILEEPKN